MTVSRETRGPSRNRAYSDEALGRKPDGDHGNAEHNRYSAVDDDVNVAMYDDTNVLAQDDTGATVIDISSVVSNVIPNVAASDERHSSLPGDPLPAKGADELDHALKQYFGFDAFRPLQREIVEAMMAGRDVFAVLPTGGGKSLCYQLPALITPGLTIVVSPLIALMKDQVDALDAAGIPGTYLNSTLDAEEARDRLRRVRRGEIRLLYVAPERLLMPSMLDELADWNVARFAIDEAHCISEWGHDFRPEYRRLVEIRDRFPNVPIIAMTATATDRVRDDIVRNVRLRNPARFVAGFNRPNLHYRIVEKERANDTTLAYIKERSEESGIVYCASRKQTEALAQFLCDARIPAAAYHAGLPPNERSRNQEAFLRDKIRVMCATTAFGMGVNKPNVRFVIHYDLPKSIEGYYQETGRAGRDGLPSECLMLFGRGDIVKQARLLEDKPEGLDRDRSFEALARMTSFAESRNCRRMELLNYFGETFSDLPCRGCDNCLEPRETFDATIAAQQFLSCVIRIRRAGGFGVGLRHIVDVLLGKLNEKILRLGHERLTTFGIGKERAAKEWERLGRELIARGFLSMSGSSMPIVALTELGRDALVERRPIMLSLPPKRKHVDVIVDERTADEKDLFEHLRTVRRAIAEERDVPAYVVFSDVTLRQMARDVPRDMAGFLRISGVGEKKAAEFGTPFLAEIADYLSR